MDKKQAIEYLRQSDKIIVPEMFTYWTHSSQFKTGESSSTRRGVWEKLPTEEFVVSGEMSFMSIINRLQYAAEHGLKNTPTAYAPATSENLDGFQIKVIIPSYTKIKDKPSQLGKDEQYLKQLAYQRIGLGDGRHPKLPNDTLIHIFAYMDYDEMSGKEVKTVIGVRDQDLQCYAEEVKKINEDAKQKKLNLENVKYDQPTRDNYTEYEKNKKVDILGDNKYSDLMKNNLNKKEIKNMITKEQIIEQYAEMLRDKDDQLSESESIKQAKQKYLEDEVLAKDFDEYTATNCFWSTPQNLISDAKPEEFANTPKSFLSVCASGLHKTCGEDLPRKDLDDFLGKAIEAGVNLEGVKKQAYMRLEMMSKSKLEYNPDDIAALRATIAYCNENELSSPYYELKDNQKMINYYQEQIAKNPEKAEEYRKKIQERENANIDFLENCDKQGIDRELAEEYLKDCKANLQREANQKKQNSMKVEDSQQKKTENGTYTDEEKSRVEGKTESYKFNWSKPAEKEEPKAADSEADAAKARYESQRQAQSHNIAEEIQQMVTPVTREELDACYNQNPEIDNRQQLEQMCRDELQREAQRRQSEEALRQQMDTARMVEERSMGMHR